MGANHIFSHLQEKELDCVWINGQMIDSFHTWLALESCILVEFIRNTRARSLHYQMRLL